MIARLFWKAKVPLVLLLLLTAGSARAQNYQEQSRYNRASYYSYSDPGDVTIQVHVWGSVSNAGLYEVTKGMQLSELFSLAGGPTIEGRSRWTDRTLTVRVLREKNGRKELVYETVMEDEVLVPEKEITLQDGDYITAETYTRQPLWRDLLPLAGSIASVGVGVYNLITIFR